jgi:4-alpha-glucanotransferase
VIAEDLGTVPDFVRHSLARIGVPGCKVLRWEREWDVPGQPFRDPSAYPALSVALSGTHDTETHAGWWDHAPLEERRLLLHVPALQSTGIEAGEPWSDRIRDALLHVMYRSGSEELFLPIQDVFGWRDRINVPGTVDARNWTWRLPWPVDRLPRIAEAAERADFCRHLAGVRS